MELKRTAFTLVAWGSLAYGLVMFGLFAGLIWKGDPYAIPGIVYVELPIPHLLGGVAGLFGWYFFRRGYRNTGKEWGVFVAKCILLTFSILLSFFVGEIGYRALLLRQKQNNSFEKFKEDRAAGRKTPVNSTHPMAAIIEPSPDNKLVYTLQANVDMDFGHRRLITNADGLRASRDYSVERAPNSVRILGIGDSGMFGWGVAQGEDYMAVLEEVLNARGDGKTYEALNLGVPGYNTQLEAEMLRVKGEKYKPDIVVVGWCENDFGLPFFLLEEENLMRKDQSYLYTWLFRRSKLSDLVGGFRMKDLRTYDKDKVVADIMAGTAEEGVMEALRYIKEQCRDMDAELLVFGPMKKDILDICTRAKVPYYNTYEKVDGSKYPKEWAVHFMHPRAEGHRVLAEHLAQELDARGWLAK